MNIYIKGSVTVIIIVIILFQLSCIKKNKEKNLSKINTKGINMILKKDTISIKDAANIIENNEKNFVLLDIRTKQEFDAFHINGAINIDYYNPDFKNNINKFDKNKKYLIYCRTAHRTIDGLKIMKSLGFKVAHMEGGITNWLKNGYKVIK